MTVGTRVETGIELVQRIAHVVQTGPAVFLLGDLIGLTNERHRVVLVFHFRYGGGDGCGDNGCYNRRRNDRRSGSRDRLLAAPGLCLFLCQGTDRFVFGHQVGCVHEHIAGIHEGFGGLFLADAHHKHARFPDACSEPGVIAVAGDQAEAVHHVGVEQVHGVNDHGAVGGILANRVAELLDRLDGMEIQHILPGIHAGGGPIAVNAADGNQAVFPGLHQGLR